MKKLIILLFLLLPLAAFPLDVVTYYFNAYDSGGEEWSTPANMVDGDIDNFAYSTLDVELLTGNTCDGTNLGTISKIELRLFGTCGNLNNGVYLRPVFSGSSDGDNHSVVIFDDWSSYVDITSDTNAPSPWTWSAVQNLDCDVEDFGGGTQGARVSKVEIQVTYETVGTTVEPAVLPLTMTLESPTVSDFASVSPSVLQLTMSLHSPTVTATDFTKIYGATIYGATLN